MKATILQDFLRGGGTETQSLHLAEVLTRHGVTTTLLTLRPGGPLEERARAMGVKVDSLQARDTGFDWYAPGLMRRLRQLQPDLLILMGKVANQWSNWIHHQWPTLPIVATLRTGKPLSLLYRRALAMADLVITNSHYAAERVRREAGRKDFPVEVVYNSLTRNVPEDRTEIRRQYREQLGVRENEVLLVTVAMFRPEKNHRIIPDLLRSSQWPPHLKWLLVGDGSERAKTIEACQNIRPDTLLCPGWQPDPAPWLCASDIAVLPSLRESLPNFLVEAQSFGLPVIAYDIGGNRECFEPDASGLLVAPGASMESSIFRLAGDAALRSAFGARAREYALHSFSRDTQDRKMAQLILDLAQKRRVSQSNSGG